MTRACDGPWLSIVGIGEDGIDGLSHAARSALAQALLIVGGARHLSLAGPLQAETMTWPSPISAAIPKILARRGKPVCVLASGDPFFHGIGSLLAAAVRRRNGRAYPHHPAFRLSPPGSAGPCKSARSYPCTGTTFETSSGICSRVRDSSV